MIDKVIKDPRFKGYCKQITGGHDLWEDLYQHTCIQMMGYTEDFNLKRLFYVIAENQWKNRNSDFNKVHRPKRFITCEDVEPAPEVEQQDHIPIMELALKNVLKKKLNTQSDSKHFSPVGRKSKRPSIWEYTGTPLESVSR